MTPAARTTRTASFTCSGTARGNSPAGVPVTDISQDGNDPDPNDDGQSSDNDEPTVFRLPVNLLEIPTLGTWGLLAMALLLGLAAVWRMRRAAA